MNTKAVGASPVMDSQAQPQMDGATAVASATALTWQKIDKALTPVIGHGGVAALYQRSLCIAALSYPWLACSPSGTHGPMDLDALRASLAGQSGSDANAASEALLGAFTGLLTSLVGTSLTERLLRSAQAPTSSGLTAQGGST